MKRGDGIGDSLDPWRYWAALRDGESYEDIAASLVDNFREECYNEFYGYGRDLCIIRGGAFQGVSEDTECCSQIKVNIGAGQLEA